MRNFFNRELGMKNMKFIIYLRLLKLISARNIHEISDATFIICLTEIS